MIYANNKQGVKTQLTRSFKAPKLEDIYHAYEVQDDYERLVEERSALFEAAKFDARDRGKPIPEEPAEVRKPSKKIVSLLTYAKNMNVYPPEIDGKRLAGYHSNIPNNPPFGRMLELPAPSTILDSISRDNDDNIADRPKTRLDDGRLVDSLYWHKIPITNRKYLFGSKFPIYKNGCGRSTQMRSTVMLKRAAGIFQNPNDIRKTKKEKEIREIIDRVNKFDQIEWMRMKQDKKNEEFIEKRARIGFGRSKEYDENSFLKPIVT